MGVLNFRSMNMDIIKKENSDIVVSRRKKRNKENKKSIFEIYKSEKTIKDYIFYLKDFLNFVYESDNDIRTEEVIDLMQDIEKEDVEDYIVHLFEDRKLQKSSVNKILFTDIKNIIGLYKVDSEKQYRNLIVLYTLFYTGMRSKELLNLKFNNYLKRENNFFFKLIQTKSGKDLYKPIHSALVIKLEEYKSYLKSLYNLSEEEEV